MGLVIFELLVQFGSGDITKVRVTEEDTVQELINKLIELRQHATLPPNTRIELSYQGKALTEPKKMLYEYGIKKSHTLDGAYVSSH
jgi:hypothetical protein